MFAGSLVPSTSPGQQPRDTSTELNWKSKRTRAGRQGVMWFAGRAFEDQECSSHMSTQNGAGGHPLCPGTHSRGSYTWMVDGGMDGCLSWSSCRPLQDTFAIRECDKSSLTHLFHPSADIILPCQTIPQQGQEVLTQLLSTRAQVIARKVWGGFVLPIHQTAIPAQGDQWEHWDKGRGSAAASPGPVLTEFPPLLCGQ